jgi:hypothetical protein
MPLAFLASLGNIVRIKDYIFMRLDSVAKFNILRATKNVLHFIEKLTFTTDVTVFSSEEVLFIP